VLWSRQFRSSSRNRSGTALRCVRPAVSPTNGQMGFLRSSRSRIHLHLKVHSRVRPAELRVGGPDGLAAFSWPLQLRCLGGRVAAQGKSFPIELGVPTYSERTTPEIRGLACQRVEQASGMRSRLEGASSAMLPSPWQKLGCLAVGRGRIEPCQP